MDLLVRTKQVAAEKAVSYISNNMIVGLGTGSTAIHAIRTIANKIKNNSLKIQGGVPTSVQSKNLAIELGIPLLSDWDEVDVTIDGALTWEKIVASSTKKQIIVVDESKLVQTLGKFPLPVEVIQFGWQVTKHKVEMLGCKANLRTHNNDLVITDNHNYILDSQFKEIKKPAELSKALNSIPGVVENGLFVNMTHLVIVGNSDGSVREIIY